MLPGEKELWGESGSGTGCFCPVSCGNVEEEASKVPGAGDISPD